MMMQGHEGPPAPWWRSARHHLLDDLPPPKPNGSNSLILILRLSALILALSSAIVMAVSSECTPSSGVVTFTYTRRFDACFVFLVGCNITATILEAAAIYLQLRLDRAAAAAVPDPDDKTVATDMDEDEEEGIGPAGIMLVVVDQLVTALLYSAMASAYVVDHDQIGACARFAGQVGAATILSLAACAAITLAAIAKDVLRTHV